MKIALLTGSSLSWNPRAFKEAAALVRAGHEVVVLGSSWVAERFEADMALARTGGFTFQSALRGGGWRTAAARARGRAGRILFGLTGIETSWQIGPILGDLLRSALRADADYYIAHSEHGAWVGRRLLGAGRKVGIDMEDWYSEDLLPETRKLRPIRTLRELERTLLRDGGHSTCTSLAMSTALASAYGCRPPLVIYNAFPWSDRNKLDGARKDRRGPASVSIHWVSQMLGYGRGLEDLFAALPRVHGAYELHLRGFRRPGFDEWFGSSVPASIRNRVFVHDPVDNAELLSRISEHDIGFAGEMKYCASKDLTVSNKILHYMLGGCAVVASDTAGQKEVAAMAGGAVSIYPSGDSEALAAALNAWIDSRDRLNAAKAAALSAARGTFCWEQQERALVDAVASAARGS